MDFPGMAWKKNRWEPKFGNVGEVGRETPPIAPRRPPKVPQICHETSGRQRGNHRGPTAWHGERKNLTRPWIQWLGKFLGGSPWETFQTSVARRGAVQRKCRGRDRRWGSKTPAAIPAASSYVFVAPRRKFLCFSSVSTGSSNVLRDLFNFVGQDDFLNGFGDGGLAWKGSWVCPGTVEAISVKKCVESWCV